MDEINTPPPVSPTPPATPSAEGTGIAPNIAAGLCAIFPLLGGILFYVLEKKNEFVRFWAMQSIFFGAAIFVSGFALMISVSITALLPVIGWLLAMLLTVAVVALNVAIFVLWIITIIKAFSNVEWEIPYIGKLARKQLAGQKLF